jgi:hypothetical protein
LTVTAAAAGRESLRGRRQRRSVFAPISTVATTRQALFVALPYISVAAPMVSSGNE